jgi:hypothetical protein
MRRQLLAMASSAALGLAISASGPASAIQLTPSPGSATDANVIQVKDRDGFGFSGRSGGDSGRSGMSRGNFSAQGGKFEARGQVQSKSIQSGGNFEHRGDSRSGYFNKKDFSQKNFSQKNFYKQDFSRGEVRRGDWVKKDWNNNNKDWNRNDWSKKDFSRWKGNRPHLAHRGWDRHHKHRFFGAFLIGVPYGYYAISAHPCYDWLYGPQGWGYYWSYDRCPV